MNVDQSLEELKEQVRQQSKRIRTLERKLRRSEINRAWLEDSKDKNQSLLRNINLEIEQAYQTIAQKNQELEWLNTQLSQEKATSERLLLNILPKDVAEELKQQGKVAPVYFDAVTVLFTDFQGFTRVASQIAPQTLVDKLDECFTAFDQIIAKHRLEKLKTIGDAYMCAGGIPMSNATNPIDAVNAALEIQTFMNQHQAMQLQQQQPVWNIRIGIHTGPVVAGVVGKNKFAYDIWGDTVNIASRMESSSEAGKVNISGATYALVNGEFACQYRGKIPIKNRGEIDMYFVDGASY